MSIEWDPALYNKGPRSLSEPSWQKDLLEFEYFGDVCVMKMTMNHLSEAGSASHWIYGDNIAEDHLMITYVRPGSEADEVLMPGMVVGDVNGKPVRTIEEFRQAWRPTCAAKSKDCLWTMTSDLGVLYVANFWEKVQEQVEEAFALPYLLTQSLKSTKDKVPEFMTINWPIEQIGEGTDMNDIHDALKAALAKGEAALKRKQAEADAAKEEEKKEPEEKPVEKVEEKPEEKKETEVAEKKWAVPEPKKTEESIAAPADAALEKPEPATEVSTPDANASAPPAPAAEAESIKEKIVNFFVGGVSGPKMAAPVVPAVDFENKAMGPLVVEKRSDGGW